MVNYNNFFNKKILLLQGPIGTYFNKVEKILLSNNNRVFKFCFNGGDYFFSNSKNKLIYNDKIKNWADYLYNFIVSEEIELIILFGDMKPIHKIAINIAKETDIESFVFEQGYLRPNFITFEREGVNNNSINIPKNINIFEKMYFEENYKFNIKKYSIKIKYSYLFSIYFGILNGIFNFIYSWKFPYYKEYFFINYKLSKEGILFIFSSIYKKYFNLFIKNKKNINSYFLIPLQLETDSQVLFHSKYKNNREFILEIISSFSKFSNKEDNIIFKVHPLDFEVFKYNKIIKEISKKYKIANRVFFITTGDLGPLIQQSKGIVTINSTVGISSLYHLKPLKVMGKAFYDLDNIVFKESLDNFWKSSFIPNQKIISNFLNYLLHYTQLSENFYSNLKEK